MCLFRLGFLGFLILLWCICFQCCFRCCSVCAIFQLFGVYLHLVSVALLCLGYSEARLVASHPGSCSPTIISRHPAEVSLVHFTLHWVLHSTTADYFEVEAQISLPNYYCSLSLDSSSCQPSSSHSSSSSPSKACFIFDSSHSLPFHTSSLPSLMILHSASVASFL